MPVRNRPIPQPNIVVATVTNRKTVMISGRQRGRATRVRRTIALPISTSSSAPMPGIEGTASVPWHARATISD